jgi:hypothetical protein
MVWRVATSLNVLLEQLNAIAPHRSKESDGSIGDAAHATRDSDHNPWYGPGIVTARDFTNDPAGGLDCHWLAAALVRSGDGRIKYIIWNRKIWSGGSWRNYTGVNPHTKHLHLSVVASAAADDPRPWNLGATQPVEDDMSERAEALIAEIHETLYSGFEWEKNKGAQIYKVLSDVVNRSVNAANTAAARADAVGAKVDALSGTLAGAAQKAVAAYLAANPPTVQIDYVALAKALAAEQDARARDNDPTTGPVT